MSMYEEQGENVYDRGGVMHPLQRLRMLALGAAATAGIDDPDAHEQLLDGIMWLGDLSGMEVVPVLREGPAGPALQLRVTHRCGNEGVLMANMGMDGMSDDGAIMLGNLVEFAVKLREGHACPPHRPSPEHQARMQRWTDSASGGARPVVDREGGPVAGLLTTGPMTPVDLETEGQRLFRQGRHAEAEIPLAREILGDEAAEQLAARPPRRRLADGPGCTPAFVPGVLAAFHDVTSRTASTFTPCLGAGCTGCSDIQCLTAQADGGDA